MPPTVIAKLDNVSFSYPNDEHRLLKNFCLTISRGDIIQLAGKNGSGKTTIFKLLDGTLKPVSGTIDYPRSVVRLDQNSWDITAENLTVEEHLHGLEQGNQGYGLKLLEQFGSEINNKMNRFVGELSGGQRQIVALCTALSIQPELVMLDEFNAYLDDEKSELALDMLSQFSTDSDAAIVFVSHRATRMDFSNKKIGL
jgi:energy-coupling factor transporter ATP-binding protein EcfA2